MTKTIDDMKHFLDNFRNDFEQRPLMFGGDLSGIEAIWFTLSSIEGFIYGINAEEARKAYTKVAQKYKCGNIGLSGRVKMEAENNNWDNMKVSEVLIGRLAEVRAIVFKKINKLN